MTALRWRYDHRDRWIAFGRTGTIFTVEPVRDFDMDALVWLVTADDKAAATFASRSDAEAHANTIEHRRSSAGDHLRQEKQPI
mgnify:CR=1 FL=1